MKVNTAHNYKFIYLQHEKKIKIMSKLNFCKNILILLDFVISCIAGGIQTSLPEISGYLFGFTAIILLIAVILVLVEFYQNKKAKQ